ncbi:VOC family protein [Nocardioides sp. GY 10127]|uniref:VOC family protein n=1 Tax=Nocardioides sp. GY 10127 TaxID=2569762 RepID=UPI0010A86E4F|nr:VOC family protein [Nocardioides sp. GY 10127]TIC81638.1 VOC family protein [Nocardioides sp. GY 10127]
MERTAPTPGQPTWIELFTTDADAACRFYADLLGWTVGESSSEFGGYRMLFLDGTPIAGVMPDDGSGAPSAWNTYLAVEDVEATVARVPDGGGTVLVPPGTVADLGRFAVLADPAGAVVGLWQPIEFAGFARFAEVGAPGWFETLSTDYDASVAFYRDVLDWPTHTMSDTPDFRYTTHGKDAEASAGIMDASGFLSAGQASWQFYLLVESTDETVARALELGGSESQPAEDTPYGRIGSLVDPLGVPFKVMQSLG